MERAESAKRNGAPTISRIGRALGHTDLEDDGAMRKRLQHSAGYGRAAKLLGVCAGVSLASILQVHAMGYASVTCEELYQHKDQIYYDNGFCLPDSQAAARGDKGRCKIKDFSEVQFSDLDRQNLMLIARNEIKKKCPKASPAPMADPFGK